MIRICDNCGEIMIDGMTNLSDFYTHEGACFINEMNKVYGIGNWNATEEAGINGGYWEANGEDTGIFYTDWEGDGCDYDDVEEYVTKEATKFIEIFKCLNHNDCNHMYLLSAMIDGVIAAVTEDTHCKKR